MHLVECEVQVEVMHSVECEVKLEVMHLFKCKVMGVRGRLTRAQGRVERLWRECAGGSLGRFQRRLKALFVQGGSCVGALE